MGLPQTIYSIALAAMACLELMRHGEPKEEKYNFAYKMIDITLTVLLLAWGGFFS